jgi:predicted acetylornithine/succinylornithine family transaminase
MSTEAFMNTYARYPDAMVEGHGCTLVDQKGKRYLDLLAGVAVVAVGHANETVAEAISKQARIVCHTSNYFWNLPGLKLAERLREISGEDYRSFFANSGTEANECAIKLARKWGNRAGKFKIIAADRSFHGRTLAALSATGQPSKWEGFEPLVPGFTHCPLNDLAAWETAIDRETAALLVEPIQGEGGIFPASESFLKGLRALCDKHGLLLIFDEIQSGCGRTGTWWAWQSYGVKPDIFTSAKGLGNGMPIGACLALPHVADAYKPGSHGSTFGGGALAASAALATLEVIETQNLRQNAERLGDLVKTLLIGAPHVIEVRGKGLMLGVQLDGDLSDAIVRKLFSLGIIANAVTPSVIRLVPPLSITEAELTHGVKIICEVLHAVETAPTRDL